MTDERLLERLVSLRETIRNESHFSSYATDTIDEAVRRLLPATAPPDSDSIPVRIAVAVRPDGVGNCDFVGEHQPDDVALMHVWFDFAVAGAIVTAHIPRRQTPEVAGTVEEVVT